MLNTIDYRLPELLAKAVDARIARAVAERMAHRIWQRDATVWTGTDEAQWLGWLQAPQAASTDIRPYESFAQAVRDRGLRTVVLLGMGGSSLAPEVLGKMLDAAAGAPRLMVLDSTHPDQIRALERAVDLRDTLAIVSSKSGSTLETKLLGDHWYGRLVDAIGTKRAGQHMVAVTDPGSQLEAAARERGFWQVFAGEPTIGGRFSALSPFGLVPSAAAGHDVRTLLGRAGEMVEACRADDASNPGIVLGAILGEAVRAGRNKLTLVSSVRARSLGAWLEQLLAESTGKNGTAIIPIDMEPLLAPAHYADDRVFLQIAVAEEREQEQEARLDALVAAGHPVVRIRLREPIAVGQEFFRWEFATAVAGAIMRVNPFDQPDVEASKIATRRAMAGTGAAGADAPVQAATVDFTLQSSLDGAATTAQDLLAAFFAARKPGGYLAVLAYLQMAEPNAAALARLRDALRERFVLPTSIQFGPRFLHSTGQAHKGGPDNGLFIVLTDSPQEVLAAPGLDATFGAVIHAQARGDASVLVERNRRVLRVQLRGDAAAGIDALRTCIGSLPVL